MIAAHKDQVANLNVKVIVQTYATRIGCNENMFLCCFFHIRVLGLTAI